MRHAHMRFCTRCDTQPPASRYTCRLYSSTRLELTFHLTQEEQTAELWLVALQVAQIASDRFAASCDSSTASILGKNPERLQPCRLLRDLQEVEANLDFWQNRLHQGSHLRFMLFGQGPISFASDVISALERKHKQRMSSATDKIERRVTIKTRTCSCMSLISAHACQTLMHL